MKNFIHLKETLKNKDVSKKLLEAIFVSTIFVINILLSYNIYIKCFVCSILAFIILTNIANVIIVYLDIKIDYWKNIIHNRVVNTYKELIDSRKEYNTKYVETVEFNEMFQLLINSTNIHVVKMACDFFKSYNRFGCKDVNNRFIVSLFTYIYDIEKLDEKYLIMHRNTQNNDC